MDCCPQRVPVEIRKVQRGCCPAQGRHCDAKASRRRNEAAPHDRLGWDLLHAGPGVDGPQHGALEANMPKVMGDKDWQANYQKFSALVESGYREIFTLVE